MYALASPGQADRIVQRLMTDSENTSNADETAADPVKIRIAEAAKRALAEAETRRAAHEAQRQPLPKEINGRKGPEPTRYGDWEKKGIASDF